MKLHINEAPTTSNRGTHYNDSELYYIDVNDMFGGGAGKIYSEDDFVNYWKVNKTYDPMLDEYFTYEDWFKDTVAYMKTIYGYELNESVKKNRYKKTMKESVNIMPDLVYDSIALLGYTCALAANDFHHIHLCAEGDKFQEIHESADNYLADVREFGDICLELAKEGNIELMNETYALDILKDNGGSDWQVADKASYNFTEAFTDMSNILSDLTQGITLIEEMDGVTSDVISVMDEWARKFSKEVNYFIAKKLGKDNEVLMSQTESMKRKHKKS